MLLANTAWLLAERGHRVLIIDWDLEAPGVHHYFSDVLVDKNLAFSEGLIDMVCQYRDLLVRNRDDDFSLEAFIEKEIDLDDYLVSINASFSSKGMIDLMPAGRQDEIYAARFNSFNWKHFFEELAGGRFLEIIKKTPGRVRFHPDR